MRVTGDLFRALIVLYFVRQWMTHTIQCNNRPVLTRALLKSELEVQLLRTFSVISFVKASSRSYLRFNTSTHPI